VERAAVGAAATTGDAAVAEAVAFAADLISLVDGGRPESWRHPAPTATIAQTAGATAANAGFVAAHAAGRAAVAAAGSEQAYVVGFASERSRQLAWLDALIARGD
jgi:hypothetical protein